MLLSKSQCFKKQIWSSACVVSWMDRLWGYLTLHEVSCNLCYGPFLEPPHVALQAAWFLVKVTNCQYRYLPLNPKKRTPRRILSNWLNFQSSRQISIAEIGNNFARDLQSSGNLHKAYSNEAGPTCTNFDSRERHSSSDSSSCLGQGPKARGRPTANFVWGSRGPLRKLQVRTKSSKP